MNEPKKKILHIIESLSVGGAEKSLIQTVNGLQSFEHIVVALSNPNSLAGQITNGRVINLGITSLAGYVKAISKIRKFIKKYKIDIVHAQLFKSTVIGRLAVGRRIPFIFTLQSMLGEDLFKNSFRARVIERQTCLKSNFIIAVSNEALRDYEKYISVEMKKKIINNSIEIKYFATGYKEFVPGEKIRLVVVANLKISKNIDYIFDALKNAEPENFELDIFGEGAYRNYLEKRIRDENLPVNLKGNVSDLHTYLREYDIYLHCSKYEGSSLAVFEAMASGLPLIVSDIPVLHENTGGNAIFVNLSNAMDLKQKLIAIKKGELDLNTNGKKGFEWVKTVAHPEIVLKQIADYYKYTLQEFYLDKANK